MSLRLVGLFLALTASLFTAGSAQASSVNDFTITNYDVEMSLSRDEVGRSVLRTEETITAHFPNRDQNRGIERAIPRSYDGHSVSLYVIGVKQADGSDWQYTTYANSDHTVVRVGDPGRYVRGEQTYVITYQQRDVTRYFDDTNVDEFYWDINGTEWRVPIDQLSLRFVIDENVTSAMTGDSACYQGRAGATDSCRLEPAGSGYVLEASNLSAGDNVTVAIAFEASTFEPYQPSLWERLIRYWGYLQLALVPLGGGLIIYTIVRFVRRTNRTSELGTIVPEYLPPPTASVTTSAHIAKGVRGSSMASQLIDLAVRHYVRLSESESKGLFGKSKTYSIEITKTLDDLRPEELELISDMFGHVPKVSEKLDLKALQNNTKYYRRTTDNDKKLSKLVSDEYELKRVDEDLVGWLRRVAAATLILGLITLSPTILVASLLSFVLSFASRSLTDRGLELRRYLEGLKLYIKVGEQERINMLQSPQGAEKVAELSNDPGDQRQRIVLYERTLPYAVLFGQERNWTKQLGKYYEQVGQQPDWYVGQAAFNAAVFTSAISSFNTATAYTSSSSSSSGGSSGSGFSGGGGGGGGGGGW